MIPNMFKIAGELEPAVFHVTARAIATHALSISAITATSWPAARPAGACSVRPACRRPWILRLIAQAATLRSRIPFVHFFDGFPQPRTRCRRFEMLTDADLARR